MQVKMVCCYLWRDILWSERRIAPRKGYEIWWAGVSIAWMHNRRKLERTILLPFGLPIIKYFPKAGMCKSLSISG